MAIAFVIRVGDLLTKLLAHTLGVLCAFPPAGAISARLLQPLFDDIHDLFIFIESYFHILTALLSIYSITPIEPFFVGTFSKKQKYNVSRRQQYIRTPYVTREDVPCGKEIIMFGCCGFFRSCCRPVGCSGNLPPIVPPIPVSTPIPVFPPLVPVPEPELRGMQLALTDSSGGTVATNCAVEFDTVETNTLQGVSYAATTGTLTINQVGTYLINWWVGIENAQPAEVLAFALSLNGTDVQTSYSDIGSGQMFGTAIVQVTAIGSTLSLINRSGASVTFVTAEGQGGLTVTQFA